MKEGFSRFRPCQGTGIWGGMGLSNEKVFRQNGCCISKPERVVLEMHFIGMGEEIK